MNKLFSRSEPTFADETTPITPFGTNFDHSGVLDEVTTGDLSGFAGPRPRTRHSADAKPKSFHHGPQPRLNLNLQNSRSIGATKDSFDFDKSPSSPGKEHKKKGFLGGIFRKKR